MLVVYMNYSKQMEDIADNIVNDFDCADCRNEIDCALENAIDTLQSIYWSAEDDNRIRVKELQKLEELKRWCSRDIHNTYDNFIWGMENNVFAPDSAYDL